MDVKELQKEDYQTKEKEYTLSYEDIEKRGGILKQDGTRTRTN